MLDNVSSGTTHALHLHSDIQSVAGGIVAGMTPLETVIKECEEEASLPEDLVRKCAR